MKKITVLLGIPLLITWHTQPMAIMPTEYQPRTHQLRTELGSVCVGITLMHVIENVLLNNPTKTLISLSNDTKGIIRCSLVGISLGLIAASINNYRHLFMNKKVNLRLTQLEPITEAQRQHGLTPNFVGNTSLNIEGIRTTTGAVIPFYVIKVGQYAELSRSYFGSTYGSHISFEKTDQPSIYKAIRKDLLDPSDSQEIKSPNGFTVPFLTTQRKKRIQKKICFDIGMSIMAFTLAWKLKN